MKASWLNNESRHAVTPFTPNKDQWYSVPVKSMLDANGKHIPFSGTVLRSIKGPFHILDFHIIPNPVKEAEFTLPFWVNSPAAVDVKVGGKILARLKVNAPPKNKTELHLLTINLSHASGKRQTLPIRIEIELTGADGEVTIPFGSPDNDVRPELVQRWTLKTSFRGIVFFALIWLTIQAVLLIGAAYMPTNSFARDLSMVSIAIGWFSGLIGLTSLANIPIKEWLNSIWVTIVMPRPKLLAGITILAALLLVWEISILRCVLVRIRYSSLVNNSDQRGNYDDKLIQAFKLVPDRTEAQLLLSRQIWGHRATEEERKTLLSKLAKVASISTESHNNCDCLDSTSAPNNPVVWLASLLPESDSFPNMSGSSNALRLISVRTNFDASLLQRLIQFPLIQIDLDNLQNVSNANLDRSKSLSDTYHSTRNFLSNSLSHNQFSLSDNQFLQEAADLLAQAAFRDGDYDTSLKYFVRALELREHHTISSTPSLRPPEKLFLYHLLRHYVGFPDQSDHIRDVTDQYLSVTQFADGLTNALFKAYYKEDLTRWKVGSFLGDDWGSGSKKINELLEKGWYF